MKQKFSLTKSNRIVIFLTGVLILLVQIVNPEYALISKGTSSEKLPEFMGGTIAIVLGIMVIPTLLGWIVWLARKRKPKAGSTVLNVLLLLSLFLWVFGSLGKINRQVQSVGEVKNLQELQQDYAKRIDLAQSPEEAESIRKEFAEKYSTQMESLKMLSSDEGEQRIYQIMQNLATNSQKSFNAWQAAFEATQEHEIVNIAVLAEKKEFDAQRTVIDTYIKKTRNHAELLTNLETNTIEQIKRSGADEKTSNNYIEGIKSSQSNDYVAMLPLLEKHEAYGKAMRSVVAYIEDTQASWKFSDGQLTFSDDELLKKFNDDVLGELLVAETELNEATVKFNGGGN